MTVHGSDLGPALSSADIGGVSQLLHAVLYTCLFSLPLREIDADYHALSTLNSTNATAEKLKACSQKGC